jgi:hypothetical protein
MVPAAAGGLGFPPILLRCPAAHPMPMMRFPTLALFSPGLLVAGSPIDLAGLRGKVVLWRSFSL